MTPRGRQETPKYIPKAPFKTNGKKVNVRHPIVTQNLSHFGAKKRQKKAKCTSKMRSKNKPILHVQKTPSKRYPVDPIMAQNKRLASTKRKIRKYRRIHDDHNFDAKMVPKIDPKFIS